MLVLCYHAASATWNDQLSIPPEQIIRTARRLSRRGRVHVTFDDAYRSVAAVVPSLCELGAQVTVFACSAYAETGAPLAVPELRREAERAPGELATMTWDGLLELAEHGALIGSHTVTHPHLPELGDSELHAELRGSREAIEDHLRRPCVSLAYPYGEHDERVRRATAGAGYECAFGLAATVKGPFAIPRVDLYRRDGALTTRLKTSPLHRPIAAVLDLTGIRRTRRPRPGVAA